MSAQGPAYATRRWAGPAGSARAPGPAKPVPLGRYAEEHLARKVSLREGTPRWLACVERHLSEAVSFFGAHLPLPEIRLKEVEAYVAHLLVRDNGRGRVLSPDTVNHYLNSLSNLFRRAVADGVAGSNPVDLLLHRPARQSAETPWLEADEMAEVLRFARDGGSPRPDLAVPFLYEMLATFAYTGLRKSEVLGLLCRDIDLRRGCVHVRPNAFRSLKTRNAERVVPLFSELRAILAPHLAGCTGRGQLLLFPSPARKRERPLQNLRRSFDRLPVPDRLAPSGLLDARADRPALRTRMLRHTYCAARLQTTDAGKPISPYTVAREMGHGDLDMVLRIYGHLGRIRVRGPEVSFQRAPRVSGEGSSSSDQLGLPLTLKA